MDSPSEISTEIDYQAALSQGLLPIREVARQTGVIPVTLRAWERRYGLVVPLRTRKGHRLYTAEDVARIRLILTWLDRGVAVGQVKGLLKEQAALPLVEPTPDSPWDQQRQHLLEAISNLAERRLDEFFNAAVALYPPQTLYRQLLQPLLEELDQRWRGQFGSQAERVFLHSWLRTKLGARLYHNNRQYNGAPILMINVSELPMEPGLWLTAWLTSSADCAVVVFDWPVPAAELPLAVARIQPCALLLYSSQPLSPGQLPRLLNGHHCPCLLAGPAAAIHQADPTPGVILAQSPLDALQALSDLGLLHNR
ncbi:MerR family transcriptional regulator [Metapseudomonas resinovorans]|uniref:MerR family transcriptional regulator n=1 Tax=Metapseudomonas resinovorans TaxID=53412 RepID=UPI000986C2D7|nr:MerR family transcriptional regulator [Pseudomonas resinovorans]GLZ86621.1 MerR family transcriptional regulator [Pseudomonas resinovorans]